MRCAFKSTSLKPISFGIDSFFLAPARQQFQLLHQRIHMSTKRGPLDLYFTRLPGPDSKKVKRAVSTQGSSKDDIKDPARDAAGNSAPWDCMQASAEAAGHDQTQMVAADAAVPKAGVEATSNKEAGAYCQHTDGTSPAAAAAGAAAAAKAAADSASAAAVTGQAVAGPVIGSANAAAAAAAGGALGALMSAARGRPLTKQAASDSKQLSSQEMREFASRNQAATEAAVRAATASGQQPQLKSLLAEPSWLEVLGPEFDKPYMVQLQSFIEKEWAANSIYPPKESIFRAFNSVPFDQVRVVILGQDPYINPGEAMGLSFSVPPGVRVPPSLQNMYKELESDLGCRRPNHGCLEQWCHQGVLLLNAALTVRAKASNSHAGQGWEGLTSAALQALAKQRSGIVFLLWGKYAQDRCAKLDMKKHHVLKSVHPSPLSAHRGFLGCKHFSTTNKLLQQSGLPPIDWQIDCL